MTFGKDKWDKAFERVQLNENRTGMTSPTKYNMFGFGRNLPLKEEGAPFQSGGGGGGAPYQSGGGAPYKSGGPQNPQAGQETGHSDSWESIKDQVGSFVEQSLKDIYQAEEDPDKQNELVNRVIGPAIKASLLKDPNANIPYKELHMLMKGGEEEGGAPEGGEEEGGAPEGGAPEGGEEEGGAPQGGAPQGGAPQQMNQSRY
jgi:hypothetical protein